MTDILDVSRALASVVASAEASVVLVHGGRSETSSGTVWGKHQGASHATLVVASAQPLEREQAIEVSAPTGRVPATLVGADPASGIALLRAEADLVPFAHADDGGLRVGEIVLALARTPRGPTARLGIVSRLGGEWRLPGGTRFDRYIETDVAPSPGLSGSALVDASGKLVGLNVAGLARSALVSLPAAGVARIVDALVAHGRVRRARLGVAVERVELPRAVADRVGRRRGLLVTSVVEGGPAERGGLFIGDVILAIGETATERVEDLRSALDEAAIDAEVDTRILRAGEEKRLVLVPEARA
jgi:S1-C subfamily serine protease